MGKKAFWLVLLVLAAGLAGSLWLAGANKVQSDLGAADRLFPGLQQQLGGVAAIHLSAVQEGKLRSVDLLREEGQWRVQGAHPYPAAQEQLATLVAELAEAKKLEAKTRLPKNYAKLGVGDVEERAGPNSGVRVQLVGASGTLADVIIGNSLSGRDGAYVREYGTAQTWLVDKNLRVAVTRPSWYRQPLAHLPAERWQEIRYQHGAQTALVLRKAPAGEPDFDLSPLPEGKVYKYPGVTASAAAVLTDVRFRDVVPQGSRHWPEPVLKAAYRSGDGLLVEVAGYVLDDQKKYLSLRASSTLSAGDVQFEAREQEVSALNAIWSPWIYEVSNAEYDKHNKSLDSFVQDAEQDAAGAKP